MGQYQQTQDMIEQPSSPPVVVNVPQTGSDALLWATGVVVPLIVAALGAYAATKSARYAAWRESARGKAARKKLTDALTDKAQDYAKKQLEK